MSETSSHKNAKTRGLSGSKTEVQIRGNRWLDARGHRNALLDKPAEKNFANPNETRSVRDFVFCSSERSVLVLPPCGRQSVGILFKMSSDFF